MHFPELCALSILSVLFRWEYPGGSQFAKSPRRSTGASASPKKVLGPRKSSGNNAAAAYKILTPNRKAPVATPKGRSPARAAPAGSSKFCLFVYIGKY
jgi:hypothetical protein